MDDVSVLLLLSNMGALGMLEGAVACGDWPDGRGLGLPVRSRFLKLSTSSETLLFIWIALSAAVRSTPSPFPCGSSVAKVREKGFDGTPVG